VIGVATLKSSRTEVIGFCIPVEDVNAAVIKVDTTYFELAFRHRAVVAFRLLTIGGVLYLIALEIRAETL
jgi:hypothetical protein